MLTVALRRVVAAARHSQHVRWRRPPEITVSGRGSGRVYYLSPDRTTPSGGVRNIYRHVDELNALGIDAAVLHTKPGFRCHWFINTTRTVAAREALLGERDVLVVPEIYGPGLHRLPAAPIKIVFNQGAYITYDFIPFAESEAGAPYAGVPNLAALLTVSEDSESLLAHTFPGIPVHRARPVIDASIFYPEDAPVARRITYTVSRRSEEREHLLHILRSRGVLEGWELAPIQGRTEAATALMMRTSALFLSFSDREGFGLPPAEAMASGCYVVGFTGLGGREYFDPEHSCPVPENDVLAYARSAEAAMAAFHQDSAAVIKKGRLASERVLARYTSAGLRDDLLALYGPILST
jgi:hypothetical protein